MWLKWLGYIGINSWREGREAPKLERARVGGRSETSREKPQVLSKHGGYNVLGHADRYPL